MSHITSSMDGIHDRSEKLYSERNIAFFVWPVLSFRRVAWENVPGEWWMDWDRANLYQLVLLFFLLLTNFSFQFFLMILGTIQANLTVFVKTNLLELKLQS